MLSQMNIFRRKDPSTETVSRENDIKTNITVEFSKGIKVLQQKQLTSEDPVGSDDDGNHLCNILEAVFLHGLKDSLTHKFSSYMHFVSQGQSDFNLNFWNFVVQFTHGDVVTQLKQLRQVTTEIGLCRAWVRVALNDGLMESYVHSMIADVRALKYFYASTAYLRDLEQPEILKSYLTGLSSLPFCLSFNSSMLNTWTVTPLTLCGVIDRTAPVGIAASKTRPAASVERDSPSTSSRDVSLAEPGGSGGRAFSKLPDNSFGVSGFTSRDVEEIKRLVSARLPDAASDSSSCVSCPDATRIVPHVDDDRGNPHHGNPPSEPRTPQGNVPNLMDISALEDSILAHIEEENISGTAMMDQVVINNHNRMDENHKQTVCQDRVLEDKPDKCSQESVIHSKDQILEDGSGFDSHGRAVEDGSSVDSQGRTLGNVSGCDSRDRTIAGAVDTSSQRCGVSTQDKTRDEVSGSNIKNLTVDCTGGDFKNPFNFTPQISPKQKSPPLEPSLSPAIACTIEQSTESLSEVSTIRHDIYSAIADAHRASEEGAPSVDSNSPRGNSLASMTGWSSHIHEKMPKLTQQNLANFKASSEDRSRAASFGALLKTYAPSSSLSNPSIDDVLHNLPVSADAAEFLPQRNQQSQSSDEQIDGDFEILQAVSPYLVLEADTGNSRVTQLHEMAVEKGLDAQNYQCLSCNRPIGLFYGKPRVCSFNGGYYCFECHENAEFYIPAAILHNWDFQKQKVSRENVEFLIEVEDQPLLDVSRVNPRLYEHVPELDEIRKLRVELCSLKTYLFSCKQSVAEDLRKTLWPREYLYDNTHLYSMLDLLQVASGQLARTLREVVRFASRHVYDCPLCSLKGFICELCNNPKVIYPFETDSTYRCPRCKAVYHRTCMVESLPCPKCQRWGLIAGLTRSVRDLGETEDYSITPP